LPFLHDTEAQRIARLAELLSDLLQLREEEYSAHSARLADTDAAIARIETEIEHRSVALDADALTESA